MERDREARARRLFEKQEEEARQKQQRRQNGKEQLSQWAGDRRRQVDQRGQSNKQQEEQFIQERKRLKQTQNPWEKVVSNVEINSSQYVGQADVTRMRQAMIARKKDITKGANINGNKKATI